jgi:hypothetical protein
MRNGSAEAAPSTVQQIYPSDLDVGRRGACRVRNLIGPRRKKRLMALRTQELTGPVSGTTGRIVDWLQRGLCFEATLVELMQAGRSHVTGTKRWLPNLYFVPVTLGT